MYLPLFCYIKAYQSDTLTDVEFTLIVPFGAGKSFDRPREQQTGDSQPAARLSGNQLWSKNEFAACRKVALEVKLFIWLAYLREQFTANIDETSVCRFVCLSVCLFNCLNVCISVGPPIIGSVFSHVCLYVSPYVCLPVGLPACLSVCRSAFSCCIYACLSL